MSTSDLWRFYDKQYFFPQLHGGKKYRDPDGTEKEFCFYSGTSKTWEILLDRLISILGQPESTLDVGAGLGIFVSVCNQNGIRSHGLEFSEYAIKHSEAKPYLKQWDIEKTPWPINQQYDWITAIDLFEHLFADRVDVVIKEMKRVAKKFIIAKICTAQQDKEVWSAMRQSHSQVIAQARRDGFEWLVASGHINSQLPLYWFHKLEDDKWKHREDLETKFKKDLPRDWRTTIILENTKWFEEEFR